MQLSPTSTTFWGIAILIGALLLGTYVSHTWLMEHQSLDWAAADGTIVSSEITTHSGAHGTRNPSAAVEYEYVVDGVTYRSDKIRWGAADDTPYELINSYQEESDVEVYYDPKAPDRAVLRRGKTRQTTLWGPALVGFFLFAGAYLLLTRNKKQNGSRVA